MTPDPWRDDPEFPAADWRAEVANHDTRVGYLEWVEHQRAAQKDAARPCKFCGGEVTSKDPDVDYCQGCFYGGLHFGDDPVVIAAMAAVVRGAGGLPASVDHTGGGCFAIMSDLAGDGSVEDHPSQWQVIVTQATNQGDDTYGPDACLPGPLDDPTEYRWAVGWICPQNDWGQGDTWDGIVTDTGDPNDIEAAVRTLRDRHEPKGGQ